jgi:hypothetical protein
MAGFEGYHRRGLISSFCAAGQTISRLSRGLDIVVRFYYPTAFPFSLSSSSPSYSLDLRGQHRPPTAATKDRDFLTADYVADWATRETGLSYHEEGLLLAGSTSWSSWEASRRSGIRRGGNRHSSWRSAL